MLKTLYKEKKFAGRLRRERKGNTVYASEFETRERKGLRLGMKGRFGMRRLKVEVVEV